MSRINVRRAGQTVMASAMTVVAAGSLTLIAQPGLAAASAPATAAASGSPNLPSAARMPRHGKLGARIGFGSALVGSAPAGNGPSLLAVDPATHTAYVANGENNNGPARGGDTVSVIDTRQCDAADVSLCKGPWPTITVGNRMVSDMPSGIAIDQKSDTVYVTNYGDNTVSVINGAICNAQHTGGCGQTPTEVPVGPGPLFISADRANHTLYVADAGSTTVSMINSATCNATNLASCPVKAPPTVELRVQPLSVGLDEVTHSVYVSTFSTGRKNSLAVLNATTCNATVRSGCSTIGRLNGILGGANDGQVDVANDTLYTANFSNTIDVFDLRHCHAGDLAGCASDKPGVVTPFPAPSFQENDLYVAVDQPLHSVYVSYQKDGLLVIVNTTACNGRHLAACAKLTPPAIHTGADPQGIALDRRTQTLYTANQAGNDVSVIAAARCNARHTTGCRHSVPSVPVSQPGAVIAVDGPAATAYVGSGSAGVAMINTRRCSARHTARCTQPLALFRVGGSPSGIAIEPSTHTVYIAIDTGARGKVLVIDDQTCNAGHRAGCADSPVLQVPGGDPDGIVVNPVTGTVYVTTVTSSGPDLISLFNGATCNAGDTAGCGQHPALLKTGHSGKGNSDLSLAVSDSTNTLYVTNVVYSHQDSHTVYVYNGATCDAVNTTGCGQKPAIVTVGDDPRGLAVDPATGTIYVVNHAEGDYAATVSVINGAACDGHHHSGCGQTPPAVPVGFGAFNIAFDPATHAVYTTNGEDSSVSVINTTTCNGHDHSGCGRATSADAVGNYPYALAVDAANGTVYVTDLEPGDVSLVPARPCTAQAGQASSVVRP
jgi:DNA-binding beta-propeller fold protein YncE